MFFLPKDRELQFPAMAILQSFVNYYDKKMQDPQVNPTKLPFTLEWDAQIEDADWQMFLRAGLEITITRKFIDDYECLIDLSDERLKPEMWPGRHATQAMGFLTGVEAPPIPQLRKIDPKVDSYRWCAADMDLAKRLDLIHLEDLIAAKPGTITGVIGRASPMTYMAVCLGLAVVEILPPGRPKDWLSKWTSPGYRMIETQDQDLWPGYIERATRSIEREIEKHLRRVRMQEQAKTGTVMV